MEKRLRVQRSLTVLQDGPGTRSGVLTLTEQWMRKVTAVKMKLKFITNIYTLKMSTKLFCLYFLSPVVRLGIRGHHSP